MSGVRMEGTRARGDDKGVAGVERRLDGEDEGV